MTPIAVYSRLSPRQVQQLDRLRGALTRAAFLRQVVAEFLKKKRHSSRQEAYRQRRKQSQPEQKVASAG